MHNCLKPLAIKYYDHRSGGGCHYCQGSPCERWHMGSRNGPKSPPKIMKLGDMCRLPRHQRYYHLTVDVNCPISSKDQLHATMWPLEERQKGLPSLFFQAIPLLMNFSLPRWYNTLSKSSPTWSLEFRTLPFHQTRNIDTTVLPCGGKKRGASHFFFVSLFLCKRFS